MLIFKKGIVKKGLWILCLSVFVFSVSAAVAIDKVVVIPLFSNGDEVQTVTSAGQVWMDRNLGAVRVAQSVDDPRAFGWLFQWGRLADGHEIPTSLTTTTTSGSDVPGHSKFITASSGTYDWRDPQNDNLWQGASSVNNPCPTGFRVPTDSEWTTEINSWNPKNRAGAFASPLKLVVAGQRIDSSGEVQNVGTDGYYWSSTVTSEDAGEVFFGSSNAGLITSLRATGYSIRCIQD